MRFLITAWIFLSFSAWADGVDEKGFYPDSVRSAPNEIKVLKPIGGEYYQELPRYQLPNGHFMLSPHHINYWRYFDKYPCHYNLGDNYPCSEFERYTGVVPTEYETKNIPEPVPMALLLSAGVVLLLRLSNGKSRIGS